MSNKKCLIVYFSQGGTTARVAESISAGLRSGGYESSLFNLRDGKPPDPTGFDLLGIGFPVYYYRLPFNIKAYAESLASLREKSFFTFALHATHGGDAAKQLAKILIEKKGNELGYFSCLGTGFFKGYLNQGYRFSVSHPTVDDLKRAEEFGHKLAAGEKSGTAFDSKPPMPLYRFERFVTNAWLARNFYRRVFHVNKDCKNCGLCESVCPTGNITGSKQGRPKWGRNCLLCLSCEVKCPQGAISSAIDWPLFYPFLKINVLKASRDPSLEHIRVIHRNGVTREVPEDKKR